MTTEEAEILELLKRFPNRYLSAADIFKTVGLRRNLNKDRSWAQAILPRMEMEGWIEANPFGEYRVKVEGDDTTQFKKALETPGMSLGDTTIIHLSDLNDDRAEAV